MPSMGQQGLVALVAINVALQLIDGLATYVGIGLGFGEANPLVAWAIAQLGAGPALVAVKVQALACLAIVWTVRRSRIAAPALAFTAAVYALCAVGPWAAAFAGVQFAGWYSAS